MDQLLLSYFGARMVISVESTDHIEVSCVVDITAAYIDGVQLILVHDAATQAIVLLTPDVLIPALVTVLPLLLLLYLLVEIIDHRVLDLLTHVIALIAAETLRADRRYRGFVLLLVATATVNTATRLLLLINWNLGVSGLLIVNLSLLLLERTMLNWHLLLTSEHC